MSGHPIPEDLEAISARLREALEANQSLAVYVDRLRGQLNEATIAGLGLVGELAARDAENQRLRDQLAHLPGYHLTDKGLAALAPKEPS